MPDIQAQHFNPDSAAEKLGFQNELKEKTLVSKPSPSTGGRRRRNKIEKKTKQGQVGEGKNRGEKPLAQNRAQERQVEL